MRVDVLTCICGRAMFWHSVWNVNVIQKFQGIQHMEMRMVIMGENCSNGTYSCLKNIDVE
jgi:hypothetical protein